MNDDLANPNCHNRLVAGWKPAGPSLSGAGKLCSKALMAGAEQQQTLYFATPEEVVQHSNLLAMRRAVEISREAV